MRLVLPPASSGELLDRAQALAGQTMGTIAHAHERAVPADLRRNKGWVGDTVERALGAGAGNKQAPDFEHLGIELKTVPLDASGRPLEATFVTQVAQPHSLFDVTWSESPTRHKLEHVLWVGVDGQRTMPVAERRIRCALLWRPSDAQWSVIAEDWHELMDLLRMGHAEELNTTIGEALHCRPKSATGDRAWSIDSDGKRVAGTRLGFYLRPKFVGGLLAEALGDADA